MGGTGIERWTPKGSQPFAATQDFFAPEIVHADKGHPENGFGGGESGDQGLKVAGDKRRRRPTASERSTSRNAVARREAERVET